MFVAPGSYNSAGIDGATPGPVRDRAGSFSRRSEAPPLVCIRSRAALVIISLNCKIARSRLR
jgi:hypothetical protein